MAAQDHIITLPTFTEPTLKTSEEACAIVNKWAGKLEVVIADKNLAALDSVFREDAWIRDFLGLSWDLRTIHGLENIAAYFKDNQERVCLRNITPRSKGPFQSEFKNPAPGVHWVESLFHFETNLGRGRGVVRLALDENRTTWRAYLLNLTLQELKGFEENVGLKRPLGYVDVKAGGNWAERREREKEFRDEDPKVLIIGAGHAGLDIAVRLRQLGVSALIIERNEHVGDSWRKRYRTLMTHDPIQYCHLPFIPFPSNWPYFVPKDKLADWLESYANVMELNVWTSTNFEGAEFDDIAKTWTATVRRADGSTRTLKPRHVVLATGQVGDPISPVFPGQDTFEGVVYHGSAHKDASILGDLSCKKVVVVGSGNSSHDICQNFYESGAGEVTMIQRGGTYVISASKGLPMLHVGTYVEGGPPIEDTDVYAQSMPIPVQFALNVHGTKDITAVDQEKLEGLTKAGFKLDFGPDGSGIYRKSITRGGGYYIDIGASQLIIDGRIKVHQSPDGIAGFTPAGLKLADGTVLDADIVVLATGYNGMRSSTRNILGAKVADLTQETWDLDEEGEVRGMWRNSGHPHYWYMGGNLALCRSYSRLLALQIKALEEGLYLQK